MSVFTNELGTPATPQFIEIVVKGHSVEADGTEQEIVQVYHARRVLGAVPVLPGAVADAFYVPINPIASLALSVGYIPDYVTGRFMDDPTQPEANGTAPSNGQVTGDRLPSFNAVTLQLQGDGRGRSFRGSKHYGPVAESSTTLDNLNAGGITLWDAMRIALDTAITFNDSSGNTWQFIILSRTLSDLTANPSVFSGCYVLAAVLNTKVGSMLRRKEGKGS